MKTVDTHFGLYMKMKPVTTHANTLLYEREVFKLLRKNCLTTFELPTKVQPWLANQDG